MLHLKIFNLNCTKIFMHSNINWLKSLQFYLQSLLGCLNSGNLIHHRLGRLELQPGLQLVKRVHFVMTMRMMNHQLSLGKVLMAQDHLRRRLSQNILNDCIVHYHHPMDTMQQSQLVQCFRMKTLFPKNFLNIQSIHQTDMKWFVLQLVTIGSKHFLDGYCKILSHHRSSQELQLDLQHFRIVGLTMN